MLKKYFKLDDFLAVGAVGEFEVEDFRIFLGLLEPFAGRFVDGLGLDHGDGEIAGQAEPVVGPLLFQAANLLGGGHDPAVGEGMLLLDLVVGPAGRIELGQDVDAAGIGFGFGHGGVLSPPILALLDRGSKISRK
jgi:hypothetical protein